MSRIFICYRRQDAPGEAGRIADWLDRHFGEHEVFMDVTELKPGVDFVDEIEKEVGSVDALVAVIGREWTSATNEQGARRLDDPTDWVRLEIGTALRRNVRVIPVLVRGATMPKLDELPDDLHGLRRRNALELTETQWRAGIEQLIEALDAPFRPAPTPAYPTHPSPALPPRRRAPDADGASEQGPATVWPELRSSPGPELPGVRLYRRRTMRFGSVLALFGLLALLNGIRVVQSDTRFHSFIDPFPSSSTFWFRNLTRIFTVLPTLTFVAGAGAGLVLATGATQLARRWFGTGLLLGFALEGAVTYAGVLAYASTGTRQLVSAVVGAAIAFGAGAWSYRLLEASERVLRRPLPGYPKWTAAYASMALLGALLTIPGLVLDWNGGGGWHEEGVSIFEHDMWGWWGGWALPFSLVATVFIAAPLVRATVSRAPNQPRILVIRIGSSWTAWFRGGLLVAFGLGATTVWLTFVGISLVGILTSPNYMTLGQYGGFIGLTGAALVAVAGLALTFAPMPSMPMPGTQTRATGE